MPKSIMPSLVDLPIIHEPLVNLPKDSVSPETPKSEFSFSARSIKAMRGIHPDLKKVCYRAMELTTHDFVITEGLRSLAQQRINVRKGASQTLHSRHLTGHAVDYVDSPGMSYNIKLMTEISRAFKKAAADLKIPIRWGGDWRGFVDTPHIELYRGRYP